MGRRRGDLHKGERECPLIFFPAKKGPLSLRGEERGEKAVRKKRVSHLFSRERKGREGGKKEGGLLFLSGKEDKEGRYSDLRGKKRGRSSHLLRGERGRSVTGGKGEGLSFFSFGERGRKGAPIPSANRREVGSEGGTRAPSPVRGKNLFGD